MTKNLKFGMRLRELREEAGLSMLQLADAIGVSDASVCKWENGLAEPKASYIMRLAEYFDCSADYLIGNDGEYRPSVKMRVVNGQGKTVPTSAKAHVTANAEIDIDISPKEADLVKAYRELTPEMKSLIKSTMAAVSAKPKKDTD